ncbi:hypothetical protein EF902_42000 [Streptomyces sp. WAC05858]|nr:hypothetical protein EF902_42000 [Streptomyces sp. WAC05858]
MDQAGSGSGVWCVQPQGGGGERSGAACDDDNAADVRARRREPGMIHETPPMGGSRPHPPIRVRPGSALPGYGRGYLMKMAVGSTAP